MSSQIVRLRPQVFGALSREDLDDLVQVEWYQRTRPGNGVADAEEAALMSLRADGLAWLDAHPGRALVWIEDGEVEQDPPEHDVCPVAVTP